MEKKTARTKKSLSPQSDSNATEKLNDYGILKLTPKIRLHKTNGENEYLLKHKQLESFTSKPYADNFNLDINIPKGCKLSLAAVQHWVNTGYLPYNNMHTEIMQTPNGEQCQDANEKAPRDNSDDNEVCSKATTEIMSKRHCANVEDCTLEVEKSLLVSHDESASTKIINNNSNNVLIDKYNMCYNRNFKEQATPIMGCIKHNMPMHTLTTILSETASMLSEENEQFQNNNSRYHNGKQLYTGRDSPVDLLQMKSTRKSVLSTSKQYLHPAFYFSSRPAKKRKIQNRRVTRLHLIQDNVRNARKCNVSKKREDKQKSSIVEPCTVTNNLTKSVGTVMLKCNSTIQSSKEKINLKPTVLLKRLPKTDTEKYKKLNRVNKDDVNSNQLFMLDHIVPAKSLPKYQTVNQKAAEMNGGRTQIPLARVKQLSKIKVKSYRNVNNKIIDVQNFNPTVQLIKLSAAEIEKYKSVNNNERKTQVNLSPQLSSARETVKKHSSIKNIHYVTEDSSGDEYGKLFHRPIRDQFSSSALYNLRGKQKSCESKRILSNKVLNKNVKYNNDKTGKRNITSNDKFVLNSEKVGSLKEVSKRCKTRVCTIAKEKNLCLNKDESLECSYSSTNTNDSREESFSILSENSHDFTSFIYRPTEMRRKKKIT